MKIDGRIKITDEVKEEAIRRYQLYLENNPKKIQEDLNLSQNSFFRIVSDTYAEIEALRNKINYTERAIKNNTTSDVAEAKKRLKAFKQQLKELKKGQ